MAETLTNLLTGAILPDAGEVSVFGRPTRAIQGSVDWLAHVDRFGIVSERAVLLEALTVIQNLALPYTLDIEPPPDDIRRRAENLAGEVELSASTWDVPVARVHDGLRVRIRLARALALDPQVVLLEHPSAGLMDQATRQLGVTVRNVAARRGSAIVALTSDRDAASAFASRVLVLEPSTGRLRAPPLEWLKAALR
jgi:ABC-type transporter Mla maintaining outer membrane lipid asymmetry ATPase subunit MlaF